jgi:GT2 family glycosyltransferase
VDVIIPFHGRVDLLARCLAALADSDPIGGTVYLVEDGSPQRLGSRTRRAFDALGLPIQWLVLQTRRGFVEAVNHGWERCRESVILVMNNDVVVPPDFMRRVEACLASDGRIAAAAPASDNPVDLFQHRETPRCGGTTDVPYLTAMCLAIRRAAVESPLFDRIFTPGYFEDLDLCCRLRAAGWKLAVIEDCIVHHDGKATFRDDPQLELLVRRNYGIFHARWGHLASQPGLDLLLWGQEAACR